MIHFMQNSTQYRHMISFAKENRKRMKVPEAKQDPKELKMHGDVRVDPYFWLNERENPEVIAYLNQENDYTSSQLEHTEGFQEALFQEIKGRIKEDDESVPYFQDGYWYYSRFEQGKEYPLYCRRINTMDSPEEVMLNVNELAADHAYYNIGGISLNTASSKLAYGEDTVSRRIYTIRFKDLVSGELLTDVLKGTTGSIAWSADDEYVFYTIKDEQTLRSAHVYRHKMGTTQAEDELIFTESDDTFNCAVFKSKSKAFILIGSWATVSSEYRYISASDPTASFTLIQPRERDLEYSVAHYQDHFYILTNWNAKNFRLMKTSVQTSEKSNWEEVIAHREDVLLEDIELFDQFLVINERSGGLTHIRVIPWDRSEEHYIDFGEDTYVAYLGNNRDFNTRILRYGYSSLTTPNSVYDYDLLERTAELKKQQEVIGGYDHQLYQAHRVMAIASDGTEVPISLVFRKDMFKGDGSNPCLIYGYGSYGHTIDPDFSSVRLSLLDRGFVYAIAHIRGGEEMGRKWYEEGKLLHKMNTFTDFIACSEQLIADKYTSPENLYAMGGSAGGLLMGAIINIRPELYHGVIASVPFVDVVTTMLDDTIPLTTGEYDEWGNPNDKAYYDYIKSYSPYDQVSNHQYPNMLVITGLHDSQVQYWEPAKWVAKLRTMDQYTNKLLLHTNMEAGHGGASGRFEAIKEVAMEYAFIFDLAGIHN